MFCVAARGRGGEKMADYLLKSTKGALVRTPEECDRHIKAYLESNPGIRDYFRRVRMVLMRDRRLVNSWGRIWSVGDDRYQDDLYRKAYGWMPPSEAAGLINSGWKALHRMAKDKGWKVKVHAQVHDELLMSTIPEEIYEICCLLYSELTITREYRLFPMDTPISLSVPVEFKVGRTWKGEKEWKGLPPKDELVETTTRIVKETT